MSTEHPLPAGIEQLLRMALVDPSLRAVLLGEDREAVLAAAQARGLALSPAAQAVLHDISTEQLRLTLEQLQLASGAPVPGSGEPVPVPAGIRPDVPPTWVSAGIQPDIPTPPSPPPGSRGPDADGSEPPRRAWWQRLFGK
jgi:hypothetical protein